jgi:2-polyprenyl-6-methoxyphenol hydroxylase-like FAD-dependent oxidoreductase
MVFGRRAFFGHVPAPDGSVWWFANVPERPEPSRAALRAIGTDTWRAGLLDLFAGDAGPAQALIRATPKLLAPTPVHAVARLPRWHAGRMVIAGDAAHAPTPSSGQGASLAIEDAVVLALALRDLGDPAAAFASYEAERRPRVERIVAWAARMNSSKAAGPVGRRVRDALMPAMLRAAAGSKAQRSIHEHHLEWTPGPAPALAR